MPFFNLPKLIYYLPTYLLILKIILENDFNLGTKLNQSNCPLSTRQIVNHFVIDYASQMTRSKLTTSRIALDVSRLTGWFFLHLSFWPIFLLKNLVEKTMNYNSVNTME